MNKTTRIFAAIAIALGTSAAVAGPLAADYADKPATSTKTRAEVKAELAEAIRTGDIIVGGETGMKANELNPGMYPAKPAAKGKTRAEVEAELAAAIKDGSFAALQIENSR